MSNVFLLQWTAGSKETNWTQRGFQNQVIVDFLNNRHAVTMSLSTLQRRLRDYGLSRRGVDVSNREVREIVQREISAPSELRGYRAVWHSLRLNHHIHVPRERVVNILCELKPAVTWKRRPRRSAMRRYTSYGPNFCWHVVTADFYLQVESVNMCK